MALHEGEIGIVVDKNSPFYGFPVEVTGVDVFFPYEGTVRVPGGQTVSCGEIHLEAGDTLDHVVFSEEDLADLSCS